MNTGAAKRRSETEFFMKKATALLLTLIMLVAMLASCSDRGNGTTTTAPAGNEGTPSDTAAATVDDNGYVLDDIPELNFNETVINILMWNDYTMTEFYDVNDSGDLIGQAITDRNSRVAQRLGIKLKFIEIPGSTSAAQKAYIQKVNADAALAPSCEYDIYATYSRTPAQLALQGYTANLLDTQYFNVEKPWWPKALMNECTIHNKLYFCSGDISTNLLWMMTGTFYNKNLLKTYNIEKSPYDLVKSNEWTFDKMAEMVKDIYEDGGDGKKSSDDKFGYVIYDVNIDAFQTAAGTVSISKDERGELIISPDFSGERQINMVSKVHQLLESDGVYQTNSTKIRNVFFEERALMITDRVFIVAGKDNRDDKNLIEFDYGIVPQPKYSADQENYMTNVGHPYTMYAINVSSSKIDECSAVLEAMGSENYRSVTPKVFEAAMKVRYASNSEAGEMYDIIRAGISFDLGRLFAGTFGNHTANLFRKSAISGSSYSTQYNIAKPVIEAGLELIERGFDK